MRVLFVCTSNKDRSPALENYFREKYPKHTYASAGINRFHCHRKGTHLLTQEDIDGCDVILFCETYHWMIARIRYDIPMRSYGYRGILKCGEYERGNVNESYLKKAEEKIKTYLQ